MITAYFWKNGQVVPFSDSTGATRVRDAGLSELYCVDVSATFNITRYGMYRSDGWHHIPLNTYPKEFLAMLLIMGVPT